DEILAVRMAQIEKDLHAGMQEKLAQQQAEAAEKQRLAEEAEKRRLAEEAEQKKLAEEAEKKRQAAAAEKQRLAEEAEQKKLAAAAEQKQLAAEAEEMKPAEKAEPQPPAEPEKTEATTPVTTDTTPDISEKKLEGLSSFYVFLIKVFGTTFIVVMVLVFIVYKLMSGKSKNAG
ncbi:MAG TPA: hypothetical protein VLN56_08630, partial [Gammaproteobacteria bacterium]|nr:hypothetical protein [Gammaproteobacteria bacterium]